MPLSDAFIENQIKETQKFTHGKNAVIALSARIESAVCAALLIKAMGKRLKCVHIDTGFNCEGESERLISFFEKLPGANVVYVDARERFMNIAEGISDPVQKRLVIGRELSDIFMGEAAGADLLAQGTLYTDFLERQKQIKSRSSFGRYRMGIENFETIEPLARLYRHEAIELGKALGIPEWITSRRPFPHLGLAARCTGALTRERLAALKKADAILCDEFTKNGLDKEIWQYFIVLPDITSVGVKDDSRYEGWPAVIRAVNTHDISAADIAEIPYSVLHKITERIITEVGGLNRVLYDITPKPTATIEWE